MNILFLMGRYPNYGGVEKVSTYLANRFSEDGHRISIVSFEQPYPELAEKELVAGIKLHAFSYPVYTRDNIRRLRDIVNAEKIDFIISQWCVPFYVARLCKKAICGTTCRLISVHHNLPDTNARIKDIEIALENHRGNRQINQIKLSLVRFVSRLSLRYTYEKSDRYVVLSPSFIPIASRFVYRESLPKALCIPNPITIPVDRKADVEKRKEIIYVGRIEYNQKRTFRIAEMWQELQPMFPDWSITIVGDGPDRVDLEHRIEGLKNIKIEGFQSPLEYYKRASILLLVSEYEGFPLVIAEGMTYGVVPAVLGSYSAVYDIINDGETGIIIPYPYSKDEAVSRLAELMSDDNLRNEMSVKATCFSAKFSMDTVVQQWYELFESQKLKLNN